MYRKMLSVADASSIVFQNIYRPHVESVALEHAVGRVLADPIAADRDLPPLDRVTMDGIALSFDVWKAGKRSFRIAGVQAAGAPPQILQQSSECFEAMTGAAVPVNTDTIVPYEDVAIRDGIATLVTDHVIRGQFIHWKGSDAHKGAALLTPGMIVSSAEIALLATVGAARVNVFTFPKTAVVSSGDELVAVSDIPEPHQVRRSNAYAVLAAMSQLGWKGETFHFPDARESMTAQLAQILREYDVVILSGGVSRGKFDFVPGALESNGISKKFHRVSQRPGKPFWFGTNDDGKTVFALPGNPVSTFLCFFRYIRPWILRSMGVIEEEQSAILAEDFAAPTGLTYFLQVALRHEDGKSMAYPVAGGGSGDLANLSNVDGFLELNGDARRGGAFRYIPFRRL